MASAGTHHGLAAHEVVLLLETDPQHGLSESQAAERLTRFGPNLLPAASGNSVLMRILRQFHSPLVYILLASGAITAMLGEYVDSAVIFGVVLANAIVGFVQESKAESALDALRSMVRTRATVLRDGHQRTLPSSELVPGDVVLLEAGDKVPADIRLTRLSRLRVDESALTGESVPVAKEAVALPESTPVADRRNMAFSGTLVTAGSGRGVTVATGAQTELGEIHRLVGAAQTLVTPLTEKLVRFSKILTVAILALAVLTFGIGLARAQDAAQTFTAAIALAVGAIPEGLPAAVTITLAIGVGRMARKRAVIRRLPAVETLGSTTVVCTDKTGTLTENQMTVCEVWTPDARFEASGSGYAPDGAFHLPGGQAVGAAADRALHWCLLGGAACNDATLTDRNGRWDVVGDPTEGAMLVAAVKGGLDLQEIAASYPRLDTVPFDSERRFMLTLHRTPGGDGAPDDGRLILAKGAVEQVVELCSGQLTGDGQIEPLKRDAVLRAAEELAGTGLRVLATAMAAGHGRQSGARADRIPESVEPLVLTGLQAMLDPPRAAAADAVRACRTAGITVKMITGDHAATATAIAERLGLLGDRPGGADGADGQVRTGTELAALPAEEYPEAVDRARVFARVSPEQKLRLVEALQERGQIVAMTGDGVNDAPALRQADIGVAMGRSGTEVAKEAADMVLTDDDFTTIESAVEEGRGVFDNLTKFIVWTLPTNLGEGLVILVAILLGTALPILPTQILWINMTTAVLLGLMLAFEPREPGIMNRPPRDPARPLLTGALGVRILLVCTLLVAGSWWLFAWEQAAGASLAEARTGALNLFVAVELFYLFSCRSLTRSAWRIGLFGNRWVIGGVALQLAGQLALTYLPAMNRLFDTAPISLSSWLRILGVAALAAAVVAVDKRVRRQAL